MTPLTYVIIGLIVGGALAAIVFFAVRRRSAPSDLLTNGRTAEEEIIRRLETLDRGLRDEFSRNREEGASAAKSQREELGKSLEGVRAICRVRLKELQQDNAKQIDKMRATVDEKLQGTLDKRLGESFKLVSDRLEQVHKGLGEMQTLATGVGDLKKVLTNVKTRGTWGEVQLENLLEQILTPGQYDKNVATRPGSNERVEFAIRLPGKDADGVPCLLPIDAKFPLADYQQLIDAQERADPVAVELFAKALERRIKDQAADIH